MRGEDAPRNRPKVALRSAAFFGNSESEVGGQATGVDGKAAGARGLRSARAGGLATGAYLYSCTLYDQVA